MAKVTNNFVPKNTAIEALNPMTKILAIFSLGLGSLIFPNSWLGIVIIIGLFFVAAMAKMLVPFAKMIFGFGIPITVMLMFIQGCYSPKNETVIFDLGFAKFCEEGALYALKIITTLLVFLGTFHYASVDCHAAGHLTYEIVRNQSYQCVAQGGFTGSVGADDTEKAAFLHLETYIFQCFMLRLAIFKTKIFYIYYYSTHHVTAFK
jgi:hypothetical protein